MQHRQADELVERYKGKALVKYQSESWLCEQIAICDNMISELQKLPAMTGQSKTKSAQNKLEHWRRRKMGYELSLKEILQKIARLENKAMKWRGIREKIRIAEVAREIAAERSGIGNKYGNNPKMESRETAEGIFQD